MALIPPQFTDAVVALGVDNPETGQRDYVASGFFYGEYNVDTNPATYHSYLVTNRHVLIGQSKIYVQVNPISAGPARAYEIPLTEESWIAHQNPSVDVAVIPINFAFLQGESAAAYFFQSNDQALDVAGLTQTGATEGDNVFVLGFPMGIGSSGNARNSVLVRGGVLARLRDTLASPVEPFVIDAAVFPGNSGGPVVSKPEFTAIAGTLASPRANLIGIVAGYIPYAETAYSLHNGKPKPRVVFEENSGLAIAYSVDCIKDATKSFEDRRSSKAPLTPTHSVEAEGDLSSDEQVAA